MATPPLPVSTQTMVVQQQGVTIHYPQVFGLQNPTAEQRINQSITKLTQSLINQQYQQQGANSFDEMIGTFEIKTNERNVLSLTLSNYAIAYHHANGLTIMKSLTFDTQTGKSYTLKELFKPHSDYVSVLSKLVKKQIADRNIPILDTFQEIAPDQDYYIADKALVLYYQPIEITPHYFGFPMFPISVYSIQDIIDENGPLGRMATNS
ncbi:DUF3298 and DUF4163 domain-containing protein [Lentibacillus songyuanensis]|uniref:DUF3298 and DUF4163 domain-containing protein n=1 Tax=Lentibacillus songyuanensis TaxID=3136161 RepID=UPI0031BAC8B6